MDILMFGFGEDWPVWERTGWRARVPSLLRAFADEDKIGKILFINNPASILRGYKNIILNRPWGTKTGDSIKLDRHSYLTKVAERIYTLDWIGFGFFSEKDSWINMAEGLNGRYIQKLIRRALDTLNMDDILIWTANPFVRNLNTAFPESFLVFDAIDNWLEHPYLKKYYCKIDCAYKQIAKQVDLITTVSNQLKDYFESRSARRVLWLPNAVDYRFYSRQDLENYAVPDDIQSIPQPILGLVGILSNDIDFELLQYIASFNKNWNVVLVGSKIEGTDISAIQRSKNIHLLGYREPQRIPDYLAAFDICISAYKMNASSDSKDPMKLYEYLASGKPVVSTDVREARKLNGAVMIVKTKEEFAQKIKEAIMSDTGENKKIRLSLAQENNWPERVKKVLDGIESIKKGTLDLSVIIVNWNTKDLLRHCLDSVYKNIMNITYEVIVIDNFSTDESIEMLKSEFPRVRLIENSENVGFGRANNQGFNISKGRNILFLNSDTHIISDKIRDLINFLEAHPDICIIGPKILNPDDTIQVSCQGFPRLWWILLSSIGLLRFLPKKIKLKFNCYFHNFDSSCYVDSVGGACILIKRKVFALLNGFDDDFFMYGEDLDLGYRALEYGFKSYFLDIPFIVHLQNQSGAKKWGSFSRLKENYRSVHLFCRKHYAGKIGVFIFRVIICFGSLVRTGLYGLAYLFTRNNRYGNSMELNKNIFLINFQNNLI